MARANQGHGCPRKYARTMHSSLYRSFVLAVGYEGRISLGFGEDMPRQALRIQVLLHPDNLVPCLIHLEGPHILYRVNLLWRPFSIALQVEYALKTLSYNALSDVNRLVQYSKLDLVDYRSQQGKNLELHEASSSDSDGVRRWIQSSGRYLRASLVKWV